MFKRINQRGINASNKKKMQPKNHIRENLIKYSIGLVRNSCQGHNNSIGSFYRKIRIHPIHILHITGV